MARLQRKKPATAKKIKPQGEEAPKGAPDGGASGPDAVAVTSPREARKKPAAPSRRAVVERKEPGAIRRRFDRAVQFLREVKIELKKVTWPSRKQTLGSTVVVIVLVLIVSVFLGVVDVALSSLVRVVLQ